MTTENRFKLARTLYNQHGRQTVSKAAEDTGITSSCINDLESNVGKPREVGYRKVAKLAKHYGVSMDWIVGLTDDPDPKVRAVDVLGISPKAIDNLIKCSNSFPGILSDIFSYNGFFGFVATLNRLKNRVCETKMAHNAIHKKGLASNHVDERRIKELESKMEQIFGYPIALLTPPQALYGAIDDVKSSAEYLGKEVSGYSTLTPAELIDHIYDFNKDEVDDFMKWLEENKD